MWSRSTARPLRSFSICRCCAGTRRRTRVMLARMPIHGRAPSPFSVRLRPRATS
jgi:hypothetical protein